MVLRSQISACRPRQSILWHETLDLRYNWLGAAILLDDTPGAHWFDQYGDSSSGSLTLSIPMSIKQTYSEMCNYLAKCQKWK